MQASEHEPVTAPASNPAAAHHDRRDLLDALCGASSPWHDLDSEGIPANPPSCHLEHRETGRA